MKHPDPPTPAWLQFSVALAIVLGGVVLGYLLISRHEGPRPRNRPTALGHSLPLIEATNTVPAEAAGSVSNRPPARSGTSARDEE